jgi:hypothetical protein
MFSDCHLLRLFSVEDRRMIYEYGGTREMILAGEEGITRRIFNIIPSLHCPRQQFCEPIYAHKQYKITSWQ